MKIANKKTVDILIFGGQSNMQGQTECLPEPNEPIDGALEYRYLTDELIPLMHPVGEYIGEDMLLCAAHQGYGSIAPFCTKTYCEETGRRAVAIHAARGDTVIAQWAKGTARYECSVNKIRAGIEKASEVGDIGKIYYIWLQGESDSIKRTNEKDYKDALTAYKNDLKADVGIDRFGIIEVGYFCKTVTWVKDRTRDEGQTTDEEIMHAQESLPQVDRDFVLLTDICKKLSLDQKYINPEAQGHYNNAAIELIGTEAGKALARLI